MCNHAGNAETRMNVDGGLAQRARLSAGKMLE